MESRLITYISLAGDDKIATLALECSSGGFEIVRETAVSGGPGPMTLSPNGRRLYAARRAINKMSGFEVDPADGKLEHLGAIGLHSDPCFISTDRAGRFLLAAYYTAGAVSVHAIDETGRLLPDPVVWTKTLPKAHCIHMDETNRYTFLPHVGESNTIFQYRFDADTGLLSDNEPARVDQPEGLGPRHYSFHPNGKFVYFDNEQGSSVTAYRFDRAAGTLAPFQTVSTLPGGFDGHNSCAQIWMTPSGRNLYASNRGHDSVAMYAVDGETGSLTYLGAEPTLATPRAFGIDPSGSCMLVGGLDSGEVASYRIDPNSGRLSHLATAYVGQQPMWFLITGVSV